MLKQDLKYYKVNRMQKNAQIINVKHEASVNVVFAVSHLGLKY